jgi:hypothetical protein
MVMRLDWADDGALETKLVAEDTDGGFAVATNMLFVDSAREAARVTLQAESLT